MRNENWHLVVLDYILDKTPFKKNVQARTSIRAADQHSRFLISDPGLEILFRIYAQLKYGKISIMPARKFSNFYLTIIGQDNTFRESKFSGTSNTGAGGIVQYIL